MSPYCQAEVEAVTRKMDEAKREYDQKLERLAQLLDMRAAKIKKLESMLCFSVFPLLVCILFVFNSFVLS